MYAWGRMRTLVLKLSCKMQSWHCDGKYISIQEALIQKVGNDKAK